MSGVIVGYYCDHTDEPIGSRTHLRDHADGKKRPAGSPAPSTIRAITYGRWDGKQKKNLPPLCPRAIPIRVSRERLTAAGFKTPPGGAW